MTETIEKPQTDTPKTAPPPKYNVIILNDDFTSMNFVVFILTNVFKHSEEKAFSIMMEIHENGSAIAGCYSKEIAETKKALTMDYARKNEFPLQCVIREV